MSISVHLLNNSLSFGDYFQYSCVISMNENFQDNFYGKKIGWSHTQYGDFWGLLLKISTSIPVSYIWESDPLPPAPGQNRFSSPCDLSFGHVLTTKPHRGWGKHNVVAFSLYTLHSQEAKIYKRFTLLQRKFCNLARATLVLLQ